MVLSFEAYTTRFVSRGIKSRMKRSWSANFRHTGNGFGAFGIWCSKTKTEVKVGQIEYDINIFILYVQVHKVTCILSMENLIVYVCTSVLLAFEIFLRYGNSSSSSSCGGW